MNAMNVMRNCTAAALLIALSGFTLTAQSLSGPTVGFVKDREGHEDLAIAGHSRVVGSGP